MPRFGPKPLVASGMLAAAGAMVWLAQLGPHSGYAGGVLGPIILAAVGVGMVIAPVINTGTFGVAPNAALRPPPPSPSGSNSAPRSARRC